MNKLMHAALPAALCLALAGGKPAEAAVTITDDPVLYWNQLMLDTLPGSAAIRTYAMMNIAMYDSLNATLGYRNSSYLSGVVNPGGTGGVAAVQAAHDILVNANPAAIAQYDAALAGSLAQFADGDGKANGIATGQAYAAAMITSRSSDGAFGSIPYTPSGLPGGYAPTPPAFGAPIFEQWGNVTPFVLDSPDQFRAAPPPALTSQAYADAFDEVKAIGSATSTTRTADQTAAAQFWGTANGSTYMRLGLEISADEGLSTFDNARLFALLGTGIADTLISLWNTKYYYDFWRPVTAIRNADSDGNPLTDADPDWLSLINAPAHPSYVSAHSALGAMTMGLLLETIGDETVCATIGPNTRCWSGLEAISADGSSSRLWGGIHFDFDRQAGLTMGTQIAAWQLSQGTFNAVPEPATWQLMIVGVGLVGAALRRPRRKIPVRPACATG
ncbi:MAG TPA: PEPxxWA-CTERM sorting domain-containing protein [Sphingomonas sp.]|nr:PEPxxWA-CTERM sorting domain-containing protein [Sphingomonas sp.]